MDMQAVLNYGPATISMAMVVIHIIASLRVFVAQRDFDTFKLAQVEKEKDFQKWLNNEFAKNSQLESLKQDLDNRLNELNNRLTTMDQKLDKMMYMIATHGGPQ